MSSIVRSQSFGRLFRPLLITVIGTAFAGLVAWTMAGMVATNSSVVSGSSHFLPQPNLYPAKVAQIRPTGARATAGKAERLAAPVAKPVLAARTETPAQKSDRHLPLKTASAVGVTRFDTVAKQAGLTPKKLAGLFTRPDSAKPQQLAAAAVAPIPNRFAGQPVPSTEQAPTVLAYASAAPGGPAGAALSTLLAPSEDDLVASQEPDIGPDESSASLPVYEDTPPAGPLPALRPRAEPASPAAAPKAEIGQPEQTEQPKAVERQPVKPKVLTYAKPSDPTEKKAGGGFGRALQNLFGGGARAGNGVAVYDISAAKVYMPDGSVLEAHSGIGHMADNPKYAHVKMNGPTPPHTYNLRMRESRFHGVEAIRMLPVDGKNKFGRDGFLTHSYLLRGGRAESHGCVAFKDYKRFLTAFKQGKVKQIIVVPSGGRESFRVASNG
ncbi:tlde1 domain-containing protein [Oryzicola mucosus]